MKVPTFHKYEITKSRFDSVGRMTARVTHFLTHQLPMIIGIIAGIFIYLSISKKFSPTGIQHYIQQIFILATIILLSIGISMLVFKGLHYLYNIVRKKTSRDYQKAMKYEMDRDKYDFWKLRFDENFWTHMDGLSVEKEILNLYSMMGYSLKSEISLRSNRLDYILSNANEYNIYLRCYSAKPIDTIDELEDIMSRKSKIRADEIHIISIKGYNKKLRTIFDDPKIKLFSTRDIALMVRDQIEK